MTVSLIAGGNRFVNRNFCSASRSRPNAGEAVVTAKTIENIGTIASSERKARLPAACGS